MKTGKKKKQTLWMESSFQERNYLQKTYLLLLFCWFSLVWRPNPAVLRNPDFAQESLLVVLQGQYGPVAVLAIKPRSSNGKASTSSAVVFLQCTRVVFL